MRVSTAPARTLATRAGLALALTGATLVPGADLVAAHVLVAPAEGRAGVLQRYGIVVPSERPVATIRVEVRFPEPLVVSEVQATPGWRTTIQRGRDGRIVGAAWEGGAIPPGHFIEFGVLARNPDGAAELAWQSIQTYEDGAETHWTGAREAEFPAAVTRIRSAAAERLARVGLGAALVLALGAAGGAVLAWRRAGRPRSPESR